MTKRINDTKKREEQIVQAAQKIFLKKGYSGTTIDDIAAEVGVVRGTILHYYNSKEKLIEAVLNNDDDPFVPSLTKLIENQNISVNERLCKVMELCSEQFSNVKPQLISYQRDYEKFRFLLDQIRIQTFYQLCEPLKKLLDNGCKEGIFSIHDTKARANSIVFAIFGITGADISPEALLEELQIIFDKFTK
ncbi:TetR/AcrR family transcriptional regulator [Anaerocolumna sp. MB42-C2]|uniref:TetR/AcrR family transcriptional regulator n=1 Tax=Anaerocolumna sp. MB42-C2 TaxID=3070997 RepID=UPI0027DF62F7|nr:TetR/AcrR family transcriptional regulator [Anaerocolumna sp. MB42-C2]WMJ90442.1 TetR/AcrR family transcriptional regulator [Anaerocolumna sp. MB42-C2]